MFKKRFSRKKDKKLEFAKAYADGTWKAFIGKHVIQKKEEMKILA